LILGLALAVRLAAGLWWQSRLAPGQKFYFGDSESYWELGQAIAAGRPYEFRSPQRKVFRAPGYPILLSPIFLAAAPDASVYWGRAVSAVCGTVAVGGVYWWARKAFDPPTAHLAAGIAAFYPGAVAMSGLILSEAPFTAVMVWQLAVWQRSRVAGVEPQGEPPAARPGGFAPLRPQAPLRPSRRETRLPTPLLFGVLAGVATLIRPSWLLFTPLAVAVAAIFGRNKKREVAFAALAIVAMTATLLPWWIRNWSVTGHFVPTTLQAGASLYDGLNPAADGASDMSHVDAFAAGKDLDEYEMDRALRTAAVDWAAQNPSAAARLAVVKLVRMWNVWPNEASFRSWPARTIVAASFIPVMLLAAMGAWQLRWCMRTVALCLAPAAYLTALHIVFVSSIRYRQSAMLPLVMLAAAAIATMVWPKRELHRLSSAAANLCASPPPPDPSPIQGEGEIGKPDP
jgi:4-amino-4-deoxy-L-arabinose transferase-like glycosyltransferase